MTFENLANSETTPKAIALYLFHHIFLPSRLPQQSDFTPHNELALLTLICQSLSEFKRHIGPEIARSVEIASVAMQHMLQVHTPLHDAIAIDEQSLYKILSTLPEPESIALYVKQQNAGMLITRARDAFQFETFELSPTNIAVTGTIGRLRRSFPGRGVTVDVARALEPGFLETLVATLAKMSTQAAPGTLPQVRKAGQLHDETRDTAHPKMVTELLHSFLSVPGESLQDDRIWKNTRDEVLWKDCLLPWRRSPMWLLIRVVLQLIFHRGSREGAQTEFDLYKVFMVFFMAELLHKSSQTRLHSDVLYQMTAKLARRLKKMGSTVNTNALDVVRRRMCTANELLMQRWSATQQSSSRDLTHDLSQLDTFDIANDTMLSLPRLDAFLESVKNRTKLSSGRAFSPTWTLNYYAPDILPPLGGLQFQLIDKEYRFVNLMVFESWIAVNLDDWLRNQLDQDALMICSQLRNVMEIYHSAASSLYQGNPELTSTMILTNLEIWIACDKAATKAHPMLLDYDPKIPIGMFQNLLLPSRKDMQRLFEAENYLDSRLRGCKPQFSQSNIYAAFGEGTCFGARTFDQSETHQVLCRKIEAYATKEREQKRREFANKKKQYDNLMQRYRVNSCNDTQCFDNRSKRHYYAHVANQCKRCLYKTQAESITIAIHEWPLPSDVLAKKSTVFELALPQSFGHWREASMFFLFDVLETEYSHQRKSNSGYSLDLQSYDGLRQFFRSEARPQRLRLISNTKPNAVTHRKEKAVGIIAESDILLRNGLHYAYSDHKASSYAGSMELPDITRHKCTYKLSSTASPLQDFLFRPDRNPSGPSPNTVISSQSQCPDDMSLDEYKALASIPLGFRIAWQNILLQLFAPTIDFKKWDVGLIVCQCIYQAGPRGTSDLREAHIIVEEDEFSSKMLQGLTESTNRCEKNWQCSAALATFTALARRLLTITKSVDIQNQCLVYLYTARKVAFTWATFLREKARNIHDDKNKIRFQQRAMESFLICSDTFAVDEAFQRTMLATDENASIFLQCSIGIQEFSDSLLYSLQTPVQYLYRRWQKACYSCHRYLAQRFTGQSSNAIDHAVKESWAAYQPTSSWKAVSNNLSYWLFTSTSLGQVVHFCLLTGELLVDGVPLDHLPKQYLNHLTYKRLFGRLSLEIVPTSVPGMEFSSKAVFRDHNVHLHLDRTAEPPEADLLVHAIKGDEHVDLVPSRHLRGSFPISFVDDYSQWYNHEDQSIEFCHRDNPWHRSHSNWRLRRHQLGENTFWKLSNEDSSLIDINGKFSRLISRVLEPLEDRFWIHPTLNHLNASILIQLPCLGLDFSLQPGSTTMMSKQYRGMCIDPYQSIGTLVGLKSQLVLKEHRQRGSSLSPSRKVLILEGEASHRATEDHLEVDIRKLTKQRVQTYDVDDRLGRLIGNESCQSKLFLCYLHALTSFCIPDPLTKRTGTEEALAILSSASVKSFDLLTQENIDMLCTIARLTPGRTYYPSNERVMQAVDWQPGLSSLSQHGFFLEYVREILNIAERAKFFHPRSYIEPPTASYIRQVSPELLSRDNARSATFRLSGFGAERHTTETDVVYEARDRTSTTKFSKSFSVAQAVFFGQSVLVEPIHSSMGERLWHYLAKGPSVDARTTKSSLVTTGINYDAGTLKKSSDFITEHWLALHKTVLPTICKFKLMIWLATLAYSDNADMDVIQTLASFQTTSEMAKVVVPKIEGPKFVLSAGASFDTDEVEICIGEQFMPFEQCPEAHWSQERYESYTDFDARRTTSVASNRIAAVRSLRACVERQWRCKSPKLPLNGEHRSTWKTYIQLENLTLKLDSLFERWNDNLQFRKYLDRIASRLPSVIVAPDLPNPLLATPTWNLCREQGFVAASDIFRNAQPPPPAKEHPQFKWGSCSRPLKRQYRLSKLIQRLEDKAHGSYEQQYVKDLHASLQAMQWGDQKTGQIAIHGTPRKEDFVEYLQACREDVHRRHCRILEAVFSPGAGQEDFPSLQHDFFQMPRINPVFILQRLNKDNLGSSLKAWEDLIADYGVSITHLQRAERMLNSWDDVAALTNELRNLGHTNWDPLVYPDTLLLEIDSGIMVREVQQDIADKMRHPPTGKNAVLQLNMGEGKSSVILPMVASSEADGSRIVCATVAKPQSKQMQQMLISKLGGLCNRRIFYMPFSRDVRVGTAEANTINSILRECMESGGVLLLQPPHILSLQLMCVESAIAEKKDISRLLLETKDLLDKDSRIIVDESDENFSVKFELVYTMGIQQSIEHSPDRWVCVHHVLDVIRKLLPESREDDFTSIEINSWPQGGFPRLRILNEDARNRLFHGVARRLSRDGSIGLPMTKHSAGVREAVFCYITKLKLTEAEMDSIEQSGLWDSPTKETLLLLRGLFAQGVLNFVFSQKRWRVDYGPDDTRIPKTRLAVPYRAMDSPAARSEFSHPEVIITLTSLSYYYEGLKDDDIFLSFHHLVRSDQSDMEYDVWVADSNGLPLAFHQLSGVNLEDNQLCTEVLFPCLRYAKSVIDYFLAHIVFPKELKEFPHKLSASGWDIGEVKPHPTTGFSGTNDSRAFLPLTVSQLDDPTQQHTNALVLEYLLQDENSVSLMPTRQDTTQSDAEALLGMVTKLDPQVRVILDVGAQVLELDNIGVAKRWLEMTKDDEQTQAVVFCDENDNICVIDRRHQVQIFHTSAFASQPDVCLVFLDEAHTRGTDLKLPENYRAAVTLGANLTKDRLVQACMRMRKLGKGQSVVFCVPNEIQQKIAAQSHTRETTNTDVCDILEWAISETFVDLSRGIWLWANQGRRHQSHKRLWGEASVNGATSLDAAHAEKFLEEEAQSLESRYRPAQHNSEELVHLSDHTEGDLITERVLSFGGRNSNSSTFREEQERELSPEVEQEREIQRPPPVKPQQHSIHPDIRALISDGTFTPDSKAWGPAFMSLSDTSASAHFAVGNFPRRIMVTNDFVKTIIPKLPSCQRYVSDLFQRSVQWILTTNPREKSTKGGLDVAIIVSPYEAQELLPEIKRSWFVRLHLYAPRPNMSFSPLDKLDLYTVPRRNWMGYLPQPSTTELNLFSGQLYFKSCEEYASACEFLGLTPGSADDDAADANMCDTGLIQFIRILMMKIRRNCESIDKTHVGRVLDYRSLGPEDFEKLS
ncbi:hypothetical protein CGCS363_v009327 [Colletotrichum siamense]|uniref:uncharacterized protein n=1 Tax=Colletotrichum siamense TaxID=690259 RepID=UPI001872C6D3|nr:uncharacterized protein CGCS363_v009327 [Colletotrichum siamense]KAF5494312.1 hypothetical protein CGCS363_v009327 [Colletotrichum siamense]